MPRQLAQRPDDILRRLQRIARMDADRRENIAVPVRELDRAAAAFERRADGDHARHARVRRAREHCVELVSELRKIQVRVRVDEHESAALHAPV